MVHASAPFVSSDSIANRTTWMVHASALFVSNDSVANRTSARDIGLRRNRGSHAWGNMHVAESIVIGEPSLNFRRVQPTRVQRSS